MTEVKGYKLFIKKKKKKPLSLALASFVVLYGLASYVIGDKKTFMLIIFIIH